MIENPLGPRAAGVLEMPMDQIAQCRDVRLALDSLQIHTGLVAQRGLEVARLIENEGEPGTINHLGFEVADTDAVVAATHRLAELGLPFKVDDTHTCCYATQDKVWTSDPDNVPWETYTVLAATDEFGARAH